MKERCANTKAKYVPKQRMHVENKPIFERKFVILKFD